MLTPHSSGSAQMRSGAHSIAAHRQALLLATRRSWRCGTAHTDGTANRAGCCRETTPVEAFLPCHRRCSVSAPSPQVMAIGTLALCYNNYEVFTGMSGSELRSCDEGSVDDRLGTITRCLQVFYGSRLRM